MIEASRLAELPLFRNATPIALTALSRCGQLVRYRTGQVIFATGSPARGWFVVLEGSVRVVRESAGRQHVIHNETRGGTLAEVPLITNGPHPATAIAAEPTECALFERAALEASIARAPEIAFLLARRLAERVQTLVERLHDRSTSSVQSRLAQFLLARQAKATTPTISLGVTQQQLAEELGSVRAVVARELARLIKRGVVESAGRGRYRIARPAELEGLASP